MNLSRCKSKSQTLVTFVGRGGQVCLSFLLAHRLPSFIADIVPPDVEELCTYKQHDVVAGNGNQYLVASPVQGSIVGSVNL